MGCCSKQIIKCYSWVIDIDKRLNKKAKKAKILDKSRINSWTNSISIC